MELLRGNSWLPYYALHWESERKSSCYVFWIIIILKQKQKYISKILYMNLNKQVNLIKLIVGSHKCLKFYELI